MRKINCAVIGVGYLGRFHAQKYSALKNVELVGVCDADPKRAQEIGDELKVESFTDPKELIGRVEAVTIAATTKQHYELCQLFLENGVHVFVEKPITAEASEGKKLIALAQEKNRVLQVGHIERWNPAISFVREQLDDVQLLEFRRLAPFKPRGADVSVVHDVMIHDIDLALSMVKSPVASLQAKGVRSLRPTWDTVYATIQFKSGAMAQFVASRRASEIERSITAYERDRYFQIDLSQQEVLVGYKGNSTEKEDPMEFQKQAIEKKDALLMETESFVDCVISGKQPLVTGEDGVNALHIVEQIVQLCEDSDQRG